MWFMAASFPPYRKRTPAPSSRSSVQVTGFDIW